MKEKWEEKRIFIVVKTYPTPSTKYTEVVCTAGVTDDGDWIRLYPVQFRDLPYERQYRKYSWIKANVTRRTEDPRIESYRPDPESIVILGDVDTSEGWRQRKAVILPLTKESLEEIAILNETHRVSLGIFKPKEVTSFYIKPDEAEWSPKQKAILNQMRLFDTRHKNVLEKIPYSFHYQFTCSDPKCRGHDLTIIDWEVAQSFRSWRHKYDRESLLKKLEEKWLHQVFAPSRDSYFIVGTHHQFQTFLILGVFWPPK
ncbi:MAG: hypothetical protein AB1767_13985 [Bacillota bacterium]